MSEVIVNTESSRVAPVSMKDVAAYLGVSKATVSRVLSGSAVISAKTRAKVLDACEKLNYHLNSNIQDLVFTQRDGRTHNIGFVMVDRKFSDPPYAPYIDGISDGLRQNSYNLVMVTLTGQERRVVDFPAVLRDKRLDGILISGNISLPLLNTLKQLGLEIIVIGNYSPTLVKDFNNIQSNLENSAYESVEIAVKSGCHELAWFGEDPNTYFNIGAINALRAAAHEYGMGFRAENCYHGSQVHCGAWEIMQPIFQQKTLPFDALICWNFMNAGEISSLINARMGWSKQSDVLLITEKLFDHVVLPNPSINYIACNAAEVARQGVKYLLERIKNNGTKGETTLQIKI